MLKKGASVVVIHGDKVLLRRKGRDRFELMGGRSHRHESAASTALRETAEEAGLRLDAGRLEPLHTLSFRAKEGAKVVHSFFLYRLTETEAVNGFSRRQEKKKPFWFPLWLVKGRMICWFGYSQAISAAKKKLARNLLSFTAN